MARKNRAKDYSKYSDWRDPNELVPYEKNAKIHDERQIRNIANSIKRFGWQQEAVITQDNVLVIGHGRRLAAMKIGCKIPVKVIDQKAEDLTDEDIRELRLADNLTNESGWNWELRDLEMQELQFEGFEFGDVSEENGSYVDDFFERGEETKEKAEVFGVKVICGTKEQVADVMEMLKEAGYSPEEL